MLQRQRLGALAVLLGLLLGFGLHLVLRVYLYLSREFFLFLRKQFGISWQPRRRSPVQRLCLDGSGLDYWEPGRHRLVQGRLWPHCLLLHRLSWDNLGPLEWLLEPNWIVGFFGAWDGVRHEHIVRLFGSSEADCLSILLSIILLSWRLHKGIGIHSPSSCLLLHWDRFWRSLGPI